VGLWNGPQQALFVAIKFPLILLLTAAGNVLLNAMLAPLLGLNMSLRGSLSANLMSVTVSSAILGGFSPVVAFLAWNMPASHSLFVYSFLMVLHVSAIALAGFVGNARLLQSLMAGGQSQAVARRVVVAWLASNLFLGSQWSWILRPFLGAPGHAVEFLRANAFSGNFYEALWYSIVHLLSH
jgi:hypothetical protein